MSTIHTHIAIDLYTKGLDEEAGSPEYITKYSSHIKPINGRKAILGIGKYGNDAAFVYADDELKDGVADDLPGITPRDTIKSCNDQGRPGCWATQLPPVGTFSWLGIAIRSGTDAPDSQTVDGDTRIFWIPTSNGGKFSVVPHPVKTENVLTVHPPPNRLIGPGPVILPLSQRQRLAFNVQSSSRAQKC